MQPLELRSAIIFAAISLNRLSIIEDFTVLETVKCRVNSNLQILILLKIDHQINAQ